MKPKFTKSPLLVCAMLLCGTSLSATAATITWGNVGTDFATDANWLPNAPNPATAPADNLIDDIATFTGTPVFQPALAAARSVNGLSFPNGGWNLGGPGVLSVGSGGITSSAAANTVSAPLTFAAAGTVTNSGTTLTLSGPITVSAPTQITNNGTQITVSGGLSGANPITFTGSGRVLLNATTNAAFNGGFTVRSGVTLVLQNNDSAGSNTTGSANNITLDGGTITNNTVSAGPGLAKVITLTANGGTLHAGGNNATRYMGFVGKITGSGKLTFTSASLTNAVYPDSDGVTIISDYTGGSEVKGLVRPKHDRGFGATSGEVLLNGGVIWANVANITYDASRVFTIGAAGGTLIPNNAVNSQDTYYNVGGSGPLTIGGGSTGKKTVVLAGTNNTFSGNISIPSDTASNLKITGSLGAGDTYAGVISGAGTFEYAGTGTQTLTGTNTYTGTTTVSGGILAVDGDAIADTGTLIINGGRLAPTGVEQVAALTLGAAPQVGNGTTYGAVGSNADVEDDTYFSGTTGWVQVGEAGFSGWIAGDFTNGAVPEGKRGANDDPDNDGIVNLLEYAVVSQDPTVPNSNISSYVNGLLSFSKNTEANGISYAIMESSDLGVADDWDEVPAGVDYVNNTNTISYNIPQGAGKNFIRLQVTEN